MSAIREAAERLTKLRGFSGAEFTARAEAAIRAVVEEAEKAWDEVADKEADVWAAKLVADVAAARRDALEEAVRIALSVDEESCLREPKCNALGHDDPCSYVYPVAVIVTRLRAALDADPVAGPPEAPHGL